VHFRRVIVKSEPKFNDYPCNLTITFAAVFNFTQVTVKRAGFTKQKKCENSLDSSLFHTFSACGVLSILASTFGGYRSAYRRTNKKSQFIFEHKKEPLQTTNIICGGSFNK